MRLRIAGFFLAAACAWGQAPAEQAVLQFANTQSIQDFQEIANLIRTVGDIRDASTDNTQKTLAISGTAEQIALGEWLFRQLDQAAPPQAPDPKYAAGENDVVQIFYLTRIPTIQEFQEIANAVRTTAEIRRAFTENAQRALVMRGTTDQIAMVAWLIAGLNRSGQTVTDQYQAGADDVVQMFRLTHSANVQDFQEVANLVRTIGNIRRAFTVNPQTVLTLRGTTDQMALAAWLVGQLDQRPPGTTAPEYRAGENDLVRVFYLTGAQSVQDFQKAANQIRTASGVKQAFTENLQKALAIRGTAEQIQICEATVKGLGL